MQPHNYARHALLPFHRAEGLLDVSKAALLLEGLKGLGSEPEAFGTDIVSLCLHGTREDRARIWRPGHDFVVDVTGSPTVTEVLCLSHIIEDRPRALETSLLGASHVAYAAVEGPSKNPSLIDLATESYRLIGERPDLRSVVFGAEAQAIMMEAEIAHRPGVETGGVIIGRFSEISNTFHVVDVMPAPPDSSFKRHEFKLGTIGLAEAIAHLGN